MQQFTILIGNLSGSTQSGSTNLELVDQYYLYRQKNGGGIVDEFNVKSYLDDPDNNIIATNFFRFLTGNTSLEQFVEIFYDDKKLSNVFNKYYNNNVVTSIGSSTAIINIELTGTTEINVSNNNYNWNGFSPDVDYYFPLSIHNSVRDVSTFKRVVSVTDEPSYYVPVIINKKFNLINKINFSEYLQDYIISSLLPKQARFGVELTDTMIQFIRQVRPDINTLFSSNNDIRKWYDITGKNEFPWAGSITEQEISSSDPNNSNSLSTLTYGGDLTLKMIKFIRQVRPDIDLTFSLDEDIKTWFDVTGKRQLPWGDITIDDIKKSDTILNNTLIKQGFIDLNNKFDLNKLWNTPYRSPDKVSAQPGLNLSIYFGSFDFVPNLSSLNPDREIIVNFFDSTWGGQKDVNEDFLVNYYGYFFAEVPGTYTFALETDDGSLLYIGDTLLIKNDGTHGRRVVRGRINLLPGFHRISLQYFQKKFSQFFRFRYSFNGSEFENIPNSLCFH